MKRKQKEIINIELEDIESEIFDTLTGFENAYKDIKNKFYSALGLDGNNLNLRYGMVELLSKKPNEKKWMSLTNKTKLDMKDYIKKYEFNDFKLLIKANTWQIIK